MLPEQLISSVTTLSGSTQYSYDAEGQLTAATYSGVSAQPDESYAYDANGNRTSSTSSAPVVIGKGNEVLFDGTYTYMYDADGNCTAKFIDANGTGVLQAGDTDVTQYTWDAGGRLVQVTTSCDLWRHAYAGGGLPLRRRRALDRREYRKRRGRDHARDPLRLRRQPDRLAVRRGLFGGYGLGDNDDRSRPFASLLVGSGDGPVVVRRATSLLQLWGRGRG